MLFALAGFSLAQPATPLRDGRCGTPLLQPPLPTLVPYPAVPRPPDAAKGERDAGGAFPNSARSDNFVVKWGDDASVDEADVDALLDAFESAWAVEVLDMGHPPPVTTTDYLFNVYLGGTGDGTPPSYGYAGYYYLDGDGYPMVVIGVEGLGDTDVAASTAAHEFYHALQDAVERPYPYEGVSAWYLEATAEWASGEALPDNDNYAMFLFGYGLLPELPLSAFDYADTGALAEYHQYGAFVFPRYLSEVLGERAMVVDSWVDHGDDDDPVHVLTDALDARGLAIADTFGDFAARNVLWDYEDGRVYGRNVRQAEGWYERTVEVAAVDAEETWAAAPAVTWPARYGYNVVRLRGFEEGTLVVGFDGDDAGTAGSPSAWRTTLVHDAVEGPAYVPFEGSVEVEEAGGGDWYLVAAAVPDSAEEGETFGWQYQFSVLPPEEDEDPPAGKEEEQGEPQACGCSSGGMPPSVLVLLGLAAIVRRRDRRS